MNAGVAWRRRRFLQGMVSAGVTAALTSNCRKPLKSGPTPESGKTHNGVNWRQFAGEDLALCLNDHPWTQGLQPLLPEFEALTGLRLQVETSPEPEYFQRMEARLRTAEESLDVFFLPMDSTAYRLWQDDLLLPLKGFINNPRLTDRDYNLFDFPEGFRLAAMYPPEGPEPDLYGIPTTFEVYILFYNKDLVNRHLDGIVPKTMGELVQAASQINQAGQGNYYGAVMRGVLADTIIDTVTGIVLNSWGDQPAPLPYNLWFDQAWDQPRFVDPKIVQGLVTYAQLMQAGPPDIANLDWPEATRLFQAGKAAFYIDASLFGPSYERAETSAVVGKVGYTVLPRFEGNSLTGHWLWGLGISRRSQKPEAAWLFVQWATSPEIEPKIAIATGGAPRFSSWLTPSEYTEATNIDFALAVQTAMRTSRPTAVLHPRWNQIAVAIVAAIHRIYEGTDATVAAQQLQATVQGLMAQLEEKA